MFMKSGCMVSHMAEHTSGMILDTVAKPTRYYVAREVYVSPVARNLREKSNEYGKLKILRVDSAI